MVSFSCSDNLNRILPNQCYGHWTERRFHHRILESLQLMQTEFSLSIDSNYIVVSDVPNNYQYFPTNEVHNLVTSYGKNKFYLFATGIFASIWLLFTNVIWIVILVLFSMLFVGLFNYLYKGSEAMGIALQMISSDRSRTTVVLGSRVQMWNSILTSNTNIEFIHQTML